MHNPFEMGLAAGPAQLLPAPGGAKRAGASNRNLITLVFSGLIYCTLLGFAQSVRAEQTGSSDEAYSALVGFVQQIEAVEPQPAKAEQTGFHGGGYHGGEYSALLDFVREIGGEPSRPPGADQPAKNYSQIDDDSYAALREFVQQAGAGQPGMSETERTRLAAAEQPKAVKPAKAKAAKKLISPEDATYVGAQVCMTCHTGQASLFNQTVMGKIFRNPRNAQEKAGCETCHGAGSAHVAAGGGRGVGGIISFRADDPAHTAEEYNGICLQCHEKGDRTLWRGSTHENRGVACTSCHTVMRNVTPKFQLAKLTETDTCFQCHKDKRAQIWRSSHMPVREGKLTCSTCHSPHGSFGESLLKEATVNDNCYKCHAEKRGPFLWEHAPVRENCLNCHDPHGSINDFLLKISRPRLCQQCHANLTGHPGNPRNPSSVYAFNRECQNCHSQHHGSNSPSGSRFHR